MQLEAPSLPTLTLACSTGDLILMQWTLQPTSLVHVNSPTPSSKQPPPRTQGAATGGIDHPQEDTLGAEASTGPGGGLNWGNHSRVQGCHEHSLDGGCAEAQVGTSPWPHGLLTLWEEV